jgi:hypothetical protein
MTAVIVTVGGGVLAAIVVMAHEWGAFVDAVILDVIIIAVAVAGWEVGGVNPGSAIGVDIAALADIVIDTLIRHIIIVVVVVVPRLADYRGAYVYVNADLGLCADANQAKGQASQ